MTVASRATNLAEKENGPVAVRTLIPGGRAVNDSDLEPPLEGEQHVLKKCAGAVHIGADLTVYQRRAFNVLLYWAMPNMPSTTSHEIDLDELAWGIGIDRVSQRMNRIVKNLEKMMQARVVWNLLDEQGSLESWESATLLPYVKVSVPDRKVSYEFTRAFQDRVYNPTEFAEIALQMQLIFRSEHALALYENTRRFLEEGETPWIPLDTFRRLMGVDGKEYYDEFKYLNARVIKRSVKQINEASDIHLELKVKRQSRMVVAIKYLVSKNANFHRDKVLQKKVVGRAAEIDPLLIRIKKYNITPQQAELLLKSYSLKDIAHALDAADHWIAKKTEQKDVVRNPAGIAYKAIVSGWRVPEEAKAAPNKVCPEKGKEAESIQKKVAKDHEVAQREANRKKWYDNYITSLSEEELAQHKTEFERSLEKDTAMALLLEKYRKNGLSGMVIGVFRNHLAARGIGPSEKELLGHFCR